MSSNTNPKQAFVENIREWVALDTESKSLWKKTKEIREKKRELSEKIHEFVNANNMQKTRIDITDGSLRFMEKKETGSLTLQYIETSLAKFIDDDDVKTIMAYIRENRSTKIVRDIGRSYTDKNKETEMEKYKEKDEENDIQE